MLCLDILRRFEPLDQVVGCTSRERGGGRCGSNTDLITENILANTLIILSVGGGTMISDSGAAVEPIL